MTMQRYHFDRQYAEIFRRNGIDVSELLRRCGLPEDQFSRADILLTQEEYYNIVEQVGRLCRDDETIVKIATREGIETFMPPAFAAYCSSNGLAFLNRFATYKKLAGPMQIMIKENECRVEVELLPANEEQMIPAAFVEFEMMLLLSILRKASAVEIKPVQVEMRHKILNPCVCGFLACDIIQATRDAICFSATDMQMPFVTRNDTMWQYIEPELRRRLSEMEIDDTMAARVRSALIELLPAGKTTIEDVASVLCMSRRTLQRKLSEENTTFQQQLNATRLLLAKNYLANGHRSSDDIAFLLGYEDTTSFLRAFNTWTGMTVSEYKSKLAQSAK